MRTLVMADRTCERCGKAFQIAAHRLNHKPARFCSATCRMHRNVPRQARFWSFVARGEGCWEWQGARLPSGYGQFDRVPAHRFAWQLTYGPIEPGLFVCHHCDNRRCVRPDHLFIGTAKENMVDASRKGRMATGPRADTANWPRGEAMWSAQLTAKDVSEIRLAYGRREASYSQLGRRYGVSLHTIADIIKYRTWRHLP